MEAARTVHNVEEKRTPLSRAQTAANAERQQRRAESVFAAFLLPAECGQDAAVRPELSPRSRGGVGGREGSAGRVRSGVATARFESLGSPQFIWEAAACCMNGEGKCAGCERAAAADVVTHT